MTNENEIILKFCARWGAVIAALFTAAGIIWYEASFRATTSSTISECKDAVKSHDEKFIKLWEGQARIHDTLAETTKVEAVMATKVDMILTTLNREVVRQDRRDPFVPAMAAPACAPMPIPADVDAPLPPVLGVPPSWPKAPESMPKAPPAGVPAP